jgi:arsenate reductase
MKVYHNPKCSNCRRALEWLDQNEVIYEPIPYLEKPLTELELVSIIDLLEDPLSNLVRTKEELFKEMAPDIETGEQVAKLIADHPGLLQRPLIVEENRAFIARPPEEVLPKKLK